MGRLIALIVALVAGLLITRAGERLPEPRPASAPATEFSAARAMADVAVIARAPHPLGSPANDAVREHLLRRMAELGLQPQARPGVGVMQFARAKNTVVGGEVVNLVGVLPGRDRAAPALVLMAHYDSVPNSPGAPDDATGVASALEIVRAMKARGVPARDVMLLITDGEESGLLGANAFFQRDPLARRAGLVLNMEARGSSGRVQMFQTSPENGGLIGLMRKGGGRPASSSLTVYLYERMPNDTDLSEVLKVGTAGMNYAFIGRQFDYHSPTSTPEWLDKGSLQDMGEQVLATASAAAFAPSLPGKEPSLVYGTTFEGFIVAYPPWGGWVALVAAAALIVVGARRARRIEAFPWTDVARGAGALLFATLGAVALLQFARHATGAGEGWMEQRFLLAQVTRWEWAVGLIGVGFLLLTSAEVARGRRITAALPLLAGAACSAFGGFDPVGLGAGVAAAVVGVLALGRPVSRGGAWTGVLAMGLLLAVIVQALAPPAAYVFAWPLLVAALAAAVTAGGAQRGYVSLVLLSIFAALGVGWLGELGHGAFQSMDLMPLLAMPLLLAGLLLWPMAQPAEGAPPGRWVGAVMVLAGLTVTAWVRFSDPYDVRHPEATHVIYQVDQTAGRAWRISAAPYLSAWSRDVLGEGITKLEHWAWGRPVHAAPAPALTGPTPSITLTRLSNGRLQLHAAPPPGADTLSLRLTPTTATQIEQVAAVPVNLSVEAKGTARVRWEAAEDGVRLVIRPHGPGSLEVSYVARRDAWPASAPLPRRPANEMPFNDSDSTYFTGVRTFSW